MLNRLEGIEHREDDNYHYLHVKGGENWHHLVQWSISQGIFGLENLALIPGCAGSAPIQNIGAYGVEFKDVCDYVEVWDIEKETAFSLSCEQCQFGYRDSIFKHQYGEGFIISAIGLKLPKNWQPVLKYGFLAKLEPHLISAQILFEKICSVRKSKLPDPISCGNAGSFFKNPVISEQDFQLLQQEYADIPYFPQKERKVKLAAGWLIDKCGLKNYQIGGAAVHQDQALVLINKNNATASDVIELAHHIRRSVAIKFNVYLQPEVRFIGANGEINSELAIS